MASAEKRVLFQLGTNNWQSEAEPAPGSGILHEIHHGAYNNLENVACYSVWPSGEHKQVNDGSWGPNVRIYELNENIPICESFSPVSARRWHGMSEEQVNEYTQTCEQLVDTFMDEIEAKEGVPIWGCVSHHTFMNPVIMKNVLLKRQSEGKHVPHHITFLHGTALKMYKNELSDDDEYPMRFYASMGEQGIFSNAGTPGYPNLLQSNSNKTTLVFQSLFPDFPEDRVILAPAGFNPRLFCPIEETNESLLGALTTKPYEGAPNEAAPIPTNYDIIVLHVGKLADWKRPDALIRASVAYEREFEGRVCTLMVGGGSNDQQKKFQDLAVELGTEHVYFCGPLMQPMLARLYSRCTIGVFPSHNEPFGMVFIECMACGTTCIGARSGGPVEFVTEDVGFLVEENENIEEFSANLGQVVIQSIRENWKERNREACLALASDYSIGSQVETLFGQTLEAFSENA